MIHARAVRDHRLHTALFFIVGLVSGWLFSLTTQMLTEETFHVQREYIFRVVDDNVGARTMHNRLVGTGDPTIQNGSTLPSSTWTPPVANNRTTDDKLHQHDDSRIAQELYKKVRVLCWVMTSDRHLNSKAVHVKATWGKRCNVLLFVSDSKNDTFPAIAGNFSSERKDLPVKTMWAFDYVYKHHLNDADWFMKADDDTYVIVENLRYLLSTNNPNDAVWFGHHFNYTVKQGYFSGAGGYVLSKEALVRFGRRNTSLCSEDGGHEDVEMGKCMEALGVMTGDSRDSLGRSRFHCLHYDAHIHKDYPIWFLKFDMYGGKLNISDFAISFHYIAWEQMYSLEFQVYHLRPYGIKFALPDNSFNRAPEK